MNRKVKNDEECLFYISIFLLDNFPDFNKIILNNNYSRLFLFNDKNYVMNYIYPIMDLDNDIIINLNFVNAGKYHMKLFINDQNFANYSLINSQKIEVSSTSFVNYCDERMNQLCKLNVNITSEDYNKESILEIKIHNKIKEVIPPNPKPSPSPSDEENKGKDKENNETSSFAATLGISLLIIIIVIAVLIIIFILLKYRRKENNIDLMPANQEMILEG